MKWKRTINKISNGTRWLEINYLDLNIKINDEIFKFNIYQKTTYTDLIIPRESFQPLNKKRHHYVLSIIGQ